MFCQRLKNSSVPLHQTEGRTRQMERKLREVEELPEKESAKLLEIDKETSLNPVDEEAEL